MFACCPYCPFTLNVLQEQTLPGVQIIGLIYSKRGNSNVPNCFDSRPMSFSDPKVSDPLMYGRTQN